MKPYTADWKAAPYFFIVSYCHFFSEPAGKAVSQIGTCTTGFSWCSPQVSRLKHRPCGGWFPGAVGLTIPKAGSEYWSARELGKILGYTEYGKFQNAI